jgi:hypothetical protein
MTSTAGHNLGFLTDDEVSTRREELHFVRAYDGKASSTDRDGCVCSSAHTRRMRLFICDENHKSICRIYVVLTEWMPRHCICRLLCQLLLRPTHTLVPQVALQNRLTKTFWDVKLDLKSPGTLLLRSPSGVVYYLAYSALQQIGEPHNDSASWSRPVVAPCAHTSCCDWMCV